MNSIVRVGDGDRLYREQWNLSGDRRVSIVLRDLNPRPQAVLFYRLIPSVFHKTLSKYTHKNSFKIFLYEQSQIRSLSGLQTSKLN
jgi:hypothetical protein